MNYDSIANAYINQTNSIILKESRNLSEATRDLYNSIGIAKTDKLLSTKIDPKIQKLHDTVFGIGKGHIEIPLENDVPEKVKEHIKSKGDGLVGENVTLKSGRIALLSKYLAKSNAPKEVQDEHQNWERNKAANSKLVITRNPAEVASASTGTHWESCANAYDEGAAWCCMPKEIKHGTLMAMHVHKDAVPNDVDGHYASKDIIGRALIKRHDSEEGAPKEISFHREQRSYGAFPEAAKKKIDEFTGKHYPQNSFTSKKESSLYNDDDLSIKAKLDHPNISHAFTPEHRHEQDREIQKTILNSPSASVSTLNNAIGSSHSSVRTGVVRHPNVTSALLDKSVNDESADVRGAVAESKIASKEHLGKLVGDEDAHVRRSVASNANTPREHLDTLIKDDNYGVLSGIASNPNATKKHLDTLVGHENELVRESVAGNPNANKEHLDKLVDDTDSDVRRAAKKNIEMRK